MAGTAGSVVVVVGASALGPQQCGLRLGSECVDEAVAFLPFRAAVVTSDPRLRGRGDPPSPPPYRVGVAAAQPGPSGPARAGLSAQRRNLGCRVRDIDGDRVAVPALRKALARVKTAGHAYLILDGTLIAIDRVAADRRFYSGKHRHHGTNV